MRYLLRGVNLRRILVEFLSSSFDRFIVGTVVATRRYFRYFKLRSVTQTRYIQISKEPPYDDIHFNASPLQFVLLQLAGTVPSLIFD